MLFNVFFLFYTACLIGSALVVVFCRQTIYAALGLISTFINAAILMLMIRAEFLSFVVMIVYIGAVAVFFLFIVMMLNINEKKEKQDFNGYKFKVYLVSGLLMAQICFFCYVYQILPDAPDLLAFPRQKNLENIVALGRIIYTNYALIFQLSGYTLLVAMVGAITLALPKKINKAYKKQSVHEQLLRTKENSLVMMNPESKKGVCFEDLKKNSRTGHLNS